MSYHEDLKIDNHSLDREWEKQALLYMEWSEKYAQAVLERDRAKERMELVRAELYEEIVNSYLNAGQKKPTETAIANEILSRSEYKKVNSNYAESVKNMNILAGAKEAMAHKKKALESMTQLWLGGYYAEPKIPSEAKEKVFERDKKRMRKSFKKRGVK